MRNWKPFFYSKHFINEHPDIELEQFVMPEKTLKKLGVEVSRARERFKEAAE